VDLAACARAAVAAGELCALILKLAEAAAAKAAAGNATGGGGGTRPGGGGGGGLPVGCGPAALAAVANGLHDYGGRVLLLSHRFNQRQLLHVPCFAPTCLVYLLSSFTATIELFFFFFSTL
jgi:hypothetical protein